MFLPKVKEKIVEATIHLYNKNFFAGCDGNISYKIDEQKILITSTRTPKRSISVNDFAIVDFSGNTLEGRPSSEKMMHLEVYKNCNDACFVIHAHPPTAISLTINNPKLKELPSKCMSEVIYSMGNVPIAPYARPGTEQMGINIRSLITKSKNIILARHGAISWGENLSETINGMERIEHVSEVVFKSLAMGGLTNLSEDEVSYLKEVRSRMGNTTL